MNPSGLASSVTESTDVIRSDTLQKGIILDDPTKYEISSQSLEKLITTQVLFPTTIEASIEHFRAIHALVKLFFGKGSYSRQEMK